MDISKLTAPCSLWEVVLLVPMSLAGGDLVLQTNMSKINNRL